MVLEDGTAMELTQANILDFCVKGENCLNLEQESYWEKMKDYTWHSLLKWSRKHKQKMKM